MRDIVAVVLRCRNGQPIRLLLVAIVGFVFVCVVLAVEPESVSSSPQGGKYRVDVHVVLVDAVVTDKEGRHIRGLDADDFEIYQNGQIQKITNLAYIVAQEETIGERQAESARTMEEQFRPPVVAFRLRPEQVHRSIAIVVDDIGMSFESMASVRRSLAEFVDEQIQPSDLVAIAMTGARMGALQQFTMDRRHLHAAVNRLRWNPMRRPSPLDGEFFDRRFAPGRRGEAAHERNLAVATLNTMRFIVEGMNELPGRKSVVLISEGFRLWYSELEGSGGSSYVMTEAARRLTEAAHRSGVVVYAVDPRGLEPLGLTARDDISGIVDAIYGEKGELAAGRGSAHLSPKEKDLIEFGAIENIVHAVLQVRREAYQNTKQGLNYLPQATGGLFLHIGNDINQHLGKVLDDQQGYYLIGYAADPETIRSGQRRRFPRISVKVKRPGLRVRYRSTFIGSLEHEQAEKPLSPHDEMIRALTSPFGASEVDLTLTALYEYDPEQGSTIRSWLYIAPGQLAFSNSDGEEEKATFEIVAATFGEKDQPVDEQSQMVTVHAKGEALGRIQQDGLVSRITVPIKKPGPYQVCVVLRDKTTDRLGAASQFVEVPDVKKGELALSGIVVLGTDADISESQSGEPAVPANMSLRRFERGMRLSYALYIYNAVLEKKTNEPQLETQVRLYRDGKEVYAGELNLFDSVRLSKEHILMADGYLELGMGMEPGTYILQYTVKDQLGKEGENTSSQWIDFEVVG